MRLRNVARWSLVVSFATFPLGAADLDVRVNEVLYRPPAGIPDAEFLELYNRGADPVDLSGWELEGSATLAVPSGVAVPAGGFVLFVKDINLASWIYPGVRLVGNYSGSLPDDGGRIRLLNRDGIVVDEFEYAGRGSWPAEAAGNGASLEKKSPELDPWFPDSWGASLTLLGTPGGPNTQLREIRALDWIVAGEDWRYAKGVEEPPADWASVSFDDSAWLAGPTGIGFGDDDDATVLDDMMGAYTSVYLRKAFEVADPARVLAVTFTVDYDDGFVLYLNGAEVARLGAGGTPGVPLPHTATAAVSHEAGVPETIDLGSEIHRLRAGTNVLAIQVLNQSLSSSDLSMIPSLRGEIEVLGVEVGLRRLVSTSVIPKSSIWSYWKGREEPSAALGEWTAAGFDDSAWPAGPAGFGFADNDDATVLADMQGNYSTVYIRKRFAVSDLASVSGMTLGVDFDDGFIAYLNGVEVARFYAPGSPGTFQPRTALATGSHEAGTEMAFDLGSRLDLLVEGENVLAVQGFNITLSNQDFSLHPRLTLLRSVAGDPEALRSGARLNEVYAPEATEGWVEIHNPSGGIADLSGYGLSDDALAPLKHTFPAGATIPAGGYLVVPESELGFQLPAGGTLLLTDPEGVILVDGKSYAIPALALSAGAHPEGGEFQVLEEPTPGAPNAPPPDRGIVIHEIMYHPLFRAGEAELEWIELYNRGAATVDLSGWKLAGEISYAFPAGAAISAGGYAVIANDPARMQARYGISGVLGAYAGSLPNDAGEIVLLDDLGNAADRVRYADDGRWPEAADGGGPSLELIDPDLDNANGQAWAASAGEGTPGAPNGAASPTVAPLVARLGHAPLVPRPAQAVTVSAEVTALDGVAEVRLYYRVAGAPSFATALMLDDGLSGDGAAGDSVYAATIPAQAAGAVVEFFVEAEGSSGLVRLVPPSAPERTALYMADDPEPRLGVPSCRIVMTPSDREELESRDVYSDALLNATFIAPERAYYAVGVRYRGEASRLLSPKSYHVELSHDDPFAGSATVELAANAPERQHLGMLLFRGADIPASLTRIVRLTFSTDPERTYVHLEGVDEDFLRRYYPRPEGEDEGSLYEGVGSGDLDYRGADAEAYRASYRKVTNEEADDWSDLVELCRVLEETPDADLPAALAAVADVAEWIRFFAAHTLLSTQEQGIARDAGDDYFAYRRPSDGRFVLIPGDLDDVFREPTERLFRPSLAAIRRVLEHPDLTADYYAALVRLAATHFSEERIADELSRLEGLVPQAALDADASFVQNRLAFVDSKTNRSFSVEIRAESLIPVGATWKFFRGVEEPSGGTLAWTEVDFPDDPWESGPTGIGYGDGDDATVLADMPGSYTTVYARHAFDVDDPERYPTLELAVDYDDGFVAYLNGVEVARANAGAAGSLPAYDSVATASREAGAPQVFAIYDAPSLLRAGRNVIAVVGLNAAIDSTDFSLAPELRSGGPVGEGCPGENYVTGSVLYLAGSAPVTATRWVKVNGAEASYDRFSGLWTYSMPLGTEGASVTVQALDKNSSAIATETITATRVSTLGGVLSEDAIWTRAKSPYLVLGSISVPAGVRLTIEPGCVFWIAEGVGFDIAGEIQALGREDAKILFTRIPCHGNWGYVTIRSRDANRLEHCEFSRSTASPGCLTVSGSNLEIEGCHIHDIEGEGVSASGSTINVRNTLVEKTNEALSIDYCRTVIEFNTLRNSIGKSDLCDANGSNNPPARIAFNTMYGTSDDGIDADKGSVYAEGNIIRNCGDQAISLVGTPGNSTVYRNILYRNGIGLAVKDSHVCVADFNTIAYNTNFGVRAIEKSSGLGGGRITLKNSIVWGSPTSLFVNSTGVITTSYSDVQGSAPPPGPGNINLDPQFVNASANDYHLQSTSPCIGTAEGGEDMGAIPYELAPRAPAELAVAGTTPTSVSLVWKDRSLVEEGFYVERRVVPPFVPEHLVREGDVWKFFRGRSEPSGGTLAWTAVDFDDSAWESGPSGIGYGDGDDATVLSDMQGSYSTVYLRRAFQVQDPTGIAALEFTIDVDDGFVAFLNGHEIARFAAGSPGTYPAFNGLATQDHEAGIPLAFEVPTAGILVAGTNVLAIHVLNAALASTDLSAIPEVATVDPSYVVREGNTWKFFRGTSEPSRGTLAWTSIDFDDSAWESGPSGFGYGDGDDATVLSDMQGAYSTVYLRHAFQVEDPSRITGLEFQIDIDDGFVAYLNGREIARFAAGTPGSRVAFDALAAEDHEAGTPLGFEVPLEGLLVSGTNVLAVQALNVALGSSDLTVIPELRDMSATPFELLAALPANSVSYVDDAIGPTAKYSYKVRAFNAYGVSAPSNVVTVEAGTLPMAPTGLAVVDFSASSIALTWNDNAANEDSYEIERAVGGGEFELLASLPADSFSYLDAAVNPGSTYSYRVRAVNSYGPSAYSNVVTQTAGRPPAAPSDLAAGEVTLDSIALSWTDNSDDETGFEIEVRVEGGEFHARDVLPADATSYVDQGLTSGWTYWYRVRAVNAAGASDYSNVVEATTGRVPAAPSDLSVVEVGLDRAALAWNDASDNETAFELERRGPGEEEFSSIAVLPANSASYADSGLESGTLYEYRVRATNEWGTSPYSNVASATTGRLPNPPSGLSVDEIGLDEIRLSWLDNSDDETAFELERSDAGAPFAQIASLPPSTTSYLDSGLLSGTEYAYRVRALNSFGPSAYSAPASATTGRLPAAPSGLVLTFRGHDSLAFSWTDNADNEAGFSIERSDAGAAFRGVAQVSEDVVSFRDSDLLPGTLYAYRVIAFNRFGASAPSDTLEATTGKFPDAPSELVATAEWLDTVRIAWRDNSDDETAFEVERRSGEGGAFVKVAEVPAGETSFIDAGLQEGRTYAYRVRAVNEFGASAYSNEAEATTPHLPAAPSALAAAPTGLDRIELSWLDNADNETGCEIERRGPGDADFVRIAALPADSTSYGDEGLLPGTAYAYRVRAVNEFGASAYSNEAEATTPHLPAAPSALAAAPTGLDRIELSWLDNADNETGCEIERRGPGDADFVRIAALPADSTSYGDEGLLPGTAYAYRVRAVNEFGASAYSNEAEATTPYPHPRIGSVEPSEGPTAGGTEVMISGSDFFEVVEVLFGTAAAQDLTVESPTRIHCTAPEGSRGAAPVTVRTAGGEDTLEGAFRYYDGYLRGDANADLALNISDPIALLSFLFLGGDPPPCAEVGDANADGRLDLSDAVFVLAYLFLGGDPIVPPEARCY
ncbi:MAG: fibronectin type III domain-containing protein [Planctomycetota bacterium]